MTLQPFVSIVIPCYNQACFLEESILSVINSSYKNTEIIIVNDGSTDNTDEVALEFEKKYSNVRYFRQQNSGPSVARNLGITNSNGTYILPLDSDDLITANYIEEAVKVLESQANVKVVYCEAEMFGEQCGRWNLPEFSILKLARRNLIFVSGLYRKSDWEKIGGYDEMMTWSLEDWDFWLSMLKDGGEVVRLPFVGFYYRIRKNTRTENARREGLKLTIAHLNEKHKEFMFRKLGGPLRRKKKMSRYINFITGTTLLILLKRYFQKKK